MSHFQFAAIINCDHDGPEGLGCNNGTALTTGCDTVDGVVQMDPIPATFTNDMGLWQYVEGVGWKCPVCDGYMQDLDGDEDEQ